MAMNTKPKGLAVALSLLICVAIVSVVFVNPFNWGVRKSEHFTEARFNAIREGEPITVVIGRLGEPLTITKNIVFPGVCGAGECDLYEFAAFASRWVVAHREAWVLVDHKGRVVHTVLNSEP